MKGPGFSVTHREEFLSSSPAIRPKGQRRERSLDKVSILPAPPRSVPASNSWTGELGKSAIMRKSGSGQAAPFLATSGAESTNGAESPAPFATTHQEVARGLGLLVESPAVDGSRAGGDLQVVDVDVRVRRQGGHIARRKIDGSRSGRCTWIMRSPASQAYQSTALQFVTLALLSISCTLSTVISMPLP